MVLRSASIRRPLLCRAVVTIFLIAMGVALSAGTFTTFGPKTYVRRAGEPITVTKIEMSKIERTRIEVATRKKEDQKKKAKAETEVRMTKTGIEP